MKKLFLTFVGTITLIALILVSCQKNETLNSDQNASKTPESIVQDIYSLKINYALHFENRDKITVPDVFVNEEIKNATVYQLLELSEMGRIQEYSHEITIYSDEIFSRTNGELVIPASERVTSVSVDPTSQKRDESAYTDKTFFIFVKQFGSWKLLTIEQLFPEYDISTPYSEDKVFTFILTNSQIEEKAKTNDQFKIMFQERKIIKHFFDKEIDSVTMQLQLNKLYEQNNLLPQQQNSPMIYLNKAGAVNYALQWTDACGCSNSTAAYNNSVYRSYNPNDCANFVSQCLHTGGGWSYVSPGNPYSNSTSLWVWWYNNKNTATTSDDIPSSTWCGANALANYVVVNNNYAAFIPIAQARAGVAGLADLIWMPASGWKTHVMIVTSVVGPAPYVIKYSAHTNNRKNSILASSMDAGIAYGHFN